VDGQTIFMSANITIAITSAGISGLTLARILQRRGILKNHLREIPTANRTTTA
jgi:2-polyprenyl-6-methoxyphenol hydroxylase-like FAD-dependent oxidoreductase